MTLKVGDVVQLKSGGLHMTVVSVAGKDPKVAWLTEDGHARSEFFPEECLGAITYKPSYLTDAASALYDIYRGPIVVEHGLGEAKYEIVAWQNTHNEVTKE